jgi:hypothetical protein
MGKNLLAIIAGYLAMMALVFGLMTLGWKLVGADGAFAPGSFQTTGLWIAITLVSAILAAVVGGRVAARLGQDGRAVVGLVALVLVLGIVFAIPVLTAAPELAAAVRPPDLPMMEAVKQAQQPAWVALLNPLIGAVGAWIGGRGRANPSA